MSSLEATGGELLLDVRNLSVDIRRNDAPALRVVKDVSLTVRRGEAVGLVGESGSGKSMTAFAVMNLFPSPRARRSVRARSCSKAATSRRSRRPNCAACAARVSAWCFRTRPATSTR